MSSGLVPSLKLTIPIFLGYLSVGFIFGVLARQAGQGTLYAFLSALLIYAGAAQFLMLNLLKTSVPLAEAFFAILLLNLRHVFYFAPVKTKLPSRGPARVYGALTLTDETFAVLSDERVTKLNGLIVSVANHIYWIAGCTLGALFGALLDTQIDSLDFALVALFTVLFLEKFVALKDSILIASLFVALLLLWLFLPQSYFVFVGILAAIAILVVQGAPRNE